MANEMLILQDAIGGFAPGQPLRAALMLTYCFDGKWLEESFIPDLFDRPVDTALVIRDRERIISEAPSLRYIRANATFSHRIFHPKLGLFVAENKAMLFIGSANLTRGGLERNLELGSVFEISPEGGPVSLFNSILEYAATKLIQEVDGEARHSLVETTVALREVIDQAPKAAKSSSSQWFLHNYDKPIWEQVLELLPHRNIARVSIISPFFEPETDPEDPVSEPADDSLFARLFSDLSFKPLDGEKPVSIYFHQSEGKTRLPVDKLSQWNDSISLYQRSATSDDIRPLHGKMVIFEGAADKRLFCRYIS